MISTSNISLSYGERNLFKDVNIKFVPGNCYGLIGANGAGKSTFIKILSGEIEADSGEVIVSPGERIAVLKQDHFTFNDFSVLHTVIYGHKKLYDIMEERERIYAKPDFSEADGIRAAELEGEFAELNGWEAESEAATLLDGLDIPKDLHEKTMAELEDNQKVRVLLAQALFGNPENLLLDEPTNHLDLESINWLEEFLLKFPNTVIVVSHDRHFLNKVCTHITDIDYERIRQYVGNYDFWYQSTLIARKQMKEEKRKREDKIAELKTFIQRFAANAAKSRQATSRKKLIEKLTIDDLKPTSRRFPYVHFKPERESGKNILTIENLNKTLDGEVVLKDFSLIVNKGDKIAFVGRNHYAKTILFEILSGRMEQDSGTYEWGVTITPAYFPKDNTDFFESDLTLIDWLRQYTAEVDETYIRGFLGRMLFSGDEALKSIRVLSGGEKVRCMLSRMMLSGTNFLIFDEPTSHLDLEAITALNNGLLEFKESLLFNSHDHQFVNSIANRIVEFTNEGIVDKKLSLDDYLASGEIKTQRDMLYHGHQRMNI